MMDGSLAQPKFQDVIGYLRELIRESSAGSRMPSFAQLQEQFGASTTTINRAFVTLEQEGLVVRRRGQGVYVAEPLAKARRHVIGLHAGDFANAAIPYEAHLLAGVRRGARLHGSEVLLLENLPETGWEKVDGVLLHGVAALRLIRRLPVEVPTVLLMWPFSHYPSVGCCDFEASRSAAEYLIELGHRRIAYLGFTQGLDVVVRVAGYRYALNEAGIPDIPRLVREMPAIPGMLNRGRLGMEEWLADDWAELAPTALLAQNDQVAMGAMQAMASAGIVVPRDVSVMGFDGTGECEICTPRLTSVEVPLELIGETAASMLIQSIETGATANRHVALPAHVVVRDSTRRLEAN